MKPAQLLMRGVSLTILFTVLGWIAWTTTPVPLLIGLGVGAALFSLRVGEAGAARAGRRVPVTEIGLIEIAASSRIFPLLMAITWSASGLPRSNSTPA